LGHITSVILCPHTWLSDTSKVSWSLSPRLPLVSLKAALDKPLVTLTSPTQRDMKHDKPIDATSAVLSLAQDGQPKFLYVKAEIKGPNACLFSHENGDPNYKLFLTVGVSAD
jgi:hypothetical protein